MSGDWETDRRPAAWRRVLGPLALVLAGVAAGIVAMPTASQPTFPIDVEPPSAPRPPAEPPEPSDLGRWEPVAAGPLATRQRVVSAWTGSELLVWGGRVALRGRWFADGAAYDPRTDRWTRMPESPLRARAGASAVWTGTELVIWGGAGAADEPTGPRGVFGAGVETARTTQSFADGAAYNPRTRRWRRLPSAPLSPRRHAAMVWTGREVVVWGGTTVTTSRQEPDGARYDPAENRWRPMRRGPLAGLDSRLVQAATLDGQVLMWVSDFAETQMALYDPSTDRWRRIRTPALAPGVVPSIASVAGGVMLWGGWRFSRGDSQPVAVRYTMSTGRWISVAQPPYGPAAGQPLVVAGGTAIAWRAGGGVAYDAVTNRWSDLPPGPSLPPDALHAWAGDRLVVWSPGGEPGSAGRGAAWVPPDPWRALPDPPGSIDAAGAAIWTGWLREGQQVLVWGGLDRGSHDVGGAYDPALGLWEAIPRPPLSRRVDPAAAWLAPEMIVVGGRDLPDAPPLRDAAAYHPGRRSWRSLPDAPVAVAGDAVVAGDGLAYAAGHRDGDVAVGVYDPATEQWTVLPPPPIETAERLHAVWTEFELWIWGTGRREGAGAAWSPRRNRWRTLPSLDGVHGTVTLTWASSRVFALATDGTIASLGRGAVQWRRYARSPIRTDAAAVAWNGTAVLAFDPAGRRLAALDPRSSAWVRAPAPPLPASPDGRLLWTGRDMFAFAGHAAARLTR